MANPIGLKGCERHCYNCGATMGFIEDQHYDRRDTCGTMECEQRYREDVGAECEEAHEQLDRDMGW